MRDGKSKSPLALMEQAIMILVFAVAAGLCVSAFVWADIASTEMCRKEWAVNLCQTVAETVKAKQGDFEATAACLDGEETGTEVKLYYDKEQRKTETESEAAYVIRLCREAADVYVTTAEVRMEDTESGGMLFRLPVSWQEVADE